MTSQRSILLACAFALVGVSVCAWWLLREPDAEGVERQAGEVRIFDEGAPVDLLPIEEPQEDGEELGGEAVDEGRTAEVAAAPGQTPSGKKKSGLPKRGDNRSFYISYVTPEGVPLAEAMPASYKLDAPIVVATLEKPGEELADFVVGKARTYGLGSYASYGGPGSNGFLTLHQPPPVWISAVAGTTVLESRPLLGDEKDIVFEVSPGDLLRYRADYNATLTFRLVDEAGLPVTDGVQFRMRGAYFEPAQQVDGYVEFDDLEAGKYWLAIEAQRLRTHREEFELVAGGAKDLGTIVLVRPRRMISGVVLDPEGYPIQGQMAQVRPHADANEPSLVPTDGNGYFKLFSQVAEELVVTGVHFGEEVVVPLPDLGIDYTDLEVRFTQGTLVTFEPAEPWDPGEARMIQISKTVQTAFGRLLFSLHFDDRPIPGRFQRRMPPGSYFIEEQPFTVGTEDVTVRYP